MRIYTKRKKLRFLRWTLIPVRLHIPRLGETQILHSPDDIHWPVCMMNKAFSTSIWREIYKVSSLNLTSVGVFRGQYARN